ncbi:hypothetical protein MP638_002515 [Amoeboaphelidium occidentale]|nr:hypothetical protein MP638_002515 [Amoeboaphelidium occidentale]
MKRKSEKLENDNSVEPPTKRTFEASSATETEVILEFDPNSAPNLKLPAGTTSLELLKYAITEKATLFDMISQYEDELEDNEALVEKLEDQRTFVVTLFERVTQMADQATAGEKSLAQLCICDLLSLDPGSIDLSSTDNAHIRLLKNFQRLYFILTSDHDDSSEDTLNDVKASIRTDIQNIINAPDHRELPDFDRLVVDEVFYVAGSIAECLAEPEAYEVFDDTLSDVASYFSSLPFIADLLNFETCMSRISDYLRRTEEETRRNLLSSFIDILNSLKDDKNKNVYRLLMIYCSEAINIETEEDKILELGEVIEECIEKGIESSE